MLELGQVIGKILGRKETPPPVPETSKTNLVDHIRNPDLARLMAFWNTPGALKGTIPYQVLDGVEETDFDHRTRFGEPTRNFYPGADIKEFKP
jgi:hypothetical protein